MIKIQYSAWHILANWYLFLSLLNLLAHDYKSIKIRTKIFLKAQLTYESFSFFLKEKLKNTVFCCKQNSMVAPKIPTYSLFTIYSYKSDEIYVGHVSVNGKGDD